MTDLCVCGSGQAAKACCVRYIKDGELPESPEALMRSRYTAFTLHDIDYIQKTMRGKALKHYDRARTQTWAERVEWLGLEVIGGEYTSGEDHGTVEFIARFREDGHERSMQEKSYFKRTNECWYYVDSEHRQVRTKPTPATAKVGRNDPCPCGSGKKYKKCCVEVANGA